MDTDPCDRIIVPLDVATLPEALALVDRLPQVTFWKVGLELFASTGPAVLTTLKKRGKKVFLDLKFHDIPNTMAGACRAAAHHGVDLLTVHGAAGKVALEASLKAAHAGCLPDQTPPQVIAVTLLTSLSEQSLAYEMRVPLKLSDYALQMALLAQESGLPGVVCSPREAKQLRKFCGADLLLVCPGVRPSCASADDQHRITTPAEAIKAGANYLVVGRPITQAPDPRVAFQKICDEIAPHL